MTQKVKMTIDGKHVEVDAGVTIFNAAKDIGIEIPHFCYHPKLSIAGNCRLCQVDVEGARAPVISCRERVRDGMIVHVNSQKAAQLRKDVLEFILINHPLDCPVCDQSGECKLQDQYFDHSLQPSRMRYPKVHKPKAKPIGPYVVLDDERCVLCTRCIRFCDEIAKEHQLILCERGDHSTIDVFPGKQLDNPYSLCTVDICPVGALTSSDFRFQKRVWFLKSTPSICTGCATGCNIWLDHDDGIAYRYRPRENEEVNECWMCDPGRMTYKRINADERVLFPMKEVNGIYERISWESATAEMATKLKTYQPSDIVGVLSVQQSLEENMAALRFFKEVLKTSSIVWSGDEHDPSFADDILRDHDRNPNTNGVKLLTQERFSEKSKGKVFVILGSLSDADEKRLISLKPEYVVLMTDIRNESIQPFAHLLLPRASHAEQEGTFVNRDGRWQRFSKAFDPKMESLPTWGILNHLASAFGSSFGYASAAEVLATGKKAIGL